jgi:microsomal dipeptidase-like Zn-dependent dipeptidase
LNKPRRRIRGCPRGAARRKGDLANARFQGHRGTMHQKYTAEVGKPDHVGIVVDWDGTKKKPTQLRGITRQTLHSPLRRSFSLKLSILTFLLSRHQKYTAEVGKPDHVGIVVDWDGTKKKIRAWEQGREKERGRLLIAQ